jgi:hypothetical protein
VLQQGPPINVTLYGNSAGYYGTGHPAAVLSGTTDAYYARQTTAVLHPDTSFYAPAIACAAATQMLAFVGTDANQTVSVKLSRDGGATWSAAAPVQAWLSGPLGSTLMKPPGGTTPSLAYLPALSSYVIAFPDRAGTIRLFVSSNEGVTWSYPTMPTLRSTEPMGLACSPTGFDCSLIFSDAAVARTPLTEFHFSLGSGGTLNNLGTRSIGYESRGAGASWSDPGLQWIWRDRSDAAGLRGTQLTTAGGSLGQLATPVINLQAPPRLLWDPSYHIWQTWQAFNATYDQ